MANNKMTGIIFSNSHDDALGGLTARRSMGSVPFASRYRLIDHTGRNDWQTDIHTRGVEETVPPRHLGTNS